MSSKRGVFGQKIVTLAQIDLDKLEIRELSEEVRRIIRDTEIESLQELLGPNWRRAIRELVEQYWTTR